MYLKLQEINTLKKLYLPTYMIDAINWEGQVDPNYAFTVYSTDMLTSCVRAPLSSMKVE